MWEAEKICGLTPFEAFPNCQITSKTWELGNASTERLHAPESTLTCLPICTTWDLVKSAPASNSDPIMGAALYNYWWGLLRVGLLNEDSGEQAFTNLTINCCLFRKFRLRNWALKVLLVICNPRVAKFNHENVLSITRKDDYDAY